MENGLIRRVVCFLTIVMIMGCASKGPEPPPPPAETTATEAPPPPPLPEPEKEEVVVTATRLNLRAQASTQSKILHVLDKGDMLTVLAWEKGWVQVQTEPGLEGWVAARYTKRRDSVPASTPDTATPPQVPDQKSTKPPVVAKTPPKSPQETTAQVPPSTPKRSETTPSPVGDFTQEDAVAAYSRFRQSLMDGDYEAFLNTIHDPPGPEEADPKQFAQLKGFLLDLIPDPAAWEVLKFAREEEPALLVVRSDLDNPDRITLTPLFFFSHEDQWKMLFETSPEFLPRQNPQADQTAITNALETNPALQLSGAPSAEPEPSATSQADTPPPPPVPAENGVASGEMVVNGKSTQLQYAYAYPRMGFSDTDPVDTIVILANMELDYEALSSWGQRAELEDIGTLFCIEMTINPDNKVISRVLRHHAFDGSPSGVSYLEKFEQQDAGQGIIAGQAYSTGEGEFFGVTYQYRAAFRAEIKEPEKPAESDQDQASAYKSTRPAKEDLTRVPRYIKDAVKPVFKAMEARAVVSGIKVISNRTTALFEFNMPEVVVYLPPFSNSDYAVVEFDDPNVIDGQGQTVPFELINGGYDGKSFAAEIRIASQQGGEPVEFARVKGTGRIKYPLKVDTRSFKPGSGGSDVEFDGPFVTYVENRVPDELFSFSTDAGPMRAYDATGGRLRPGGYSATSMRDKISRKTVAYRGNVTELQLDAPRDWVDIEFTYDLPPMAPKPESLAGKSATRPNPLADTPGGKVEVNLVTTTQSKQEQAPDVKKDTTVDQSTVKKKKINKPVWQNAKAVMEEILQVAGPQIEPVYFHFGATGEEFLTFHYQPDTNNVNLKQVRYTRGSVTKPRPSSIGRQCPPFPLETVDFGLVADIFDDMQNRTERGYSIGVTLGRRLSKGCKAPEWQGVAQYMDKLLIVTYTLGGKEIDVAEH